MRSTWSIIFGALAQLALAGCSDLDRGFIEAQRADAMPQGDGAVHGDEDAGEPGDAGPSMDGAIDLDATTMDAAVLGLDGSLELPMGTLITADGKTLILPDGEVIDLDTAIMRYKPEVDVTTCAIAEADMWSTPIDDVSEEGSFSLVPGPIGFALAYRSTDGMTNVGLMAIPGSNTFPEPRPLFPATQSNAIGDVALLNRNAVCPLSQPLCSEARLQLAWVDNFTGSDELHTQALSADLKDEVEPRTQVNAEDDLDESETRPALAEIGGHVLAAWITRGEAGDVISTRVLGDDTDIADVVGADFHQKPIALSMATLGPATVGLTWVSADGDNPGIWLQRLDQDGLALDMPVKLSSSVGPGSSISIASHEEGGAMVYGISIEGVKQVRYRRLGTAGELLGAEVTIVGTDFRSTAPSLYALGSGYALVYRAIPGRGGIEQPQIRITFIPKDGTIPTDPSGHLLSSQIATTNAESDSRTMVAVSIEGEVMVAWIDTDGTDSSHKLLRVVRRTLDCTQ